MSAIRFTPEKFHEYQQQWTQPVADGDVQGQKQKQNAAYWVAYCYWFGTGGIPVEDEDANSAEAQRILEQVIHEQDRIDGDNHHDNTGKHRCLLANIMIPTADALQYEIDEVDEQFYRPAVPRLEIEVQEGGNDENYQEAAYHLGECLGWGQGVNEDLPRGIHWLKAAAELGHKFAQGSIEVHCFLEPFVAETFSWLQRVADQTNNPWAQLQLGNCYGNACGVGKDLVKALEWYNKAIAQGYIRATRGKEGLLRRLSPEERSKTLGCVARNQKIEKASDLVQQSFVGGAPLSLWSHALACFQHQENPPWEAPSPTFLSLKDAIMPQLRKQLKKQEKKNRKRNLQSGNEKPGPFKRSG